MTDKKRGQRDFLVRCDMSPRNARGTRPFTKSVAFLGAAAMVAAFAMDQKAAAQGCAEEIRWIRQFGTANFDAAQGVAVDATGNVYVAGYAGSALPGQTSPGGPFVRKYDPAGTELWTRQFGYGPDWAWDVAVDQVAADVYVVGYIGTPSGHYGFLRRYDSFGSEVWTRQFDAVSEARGAAVDAAGNTYVAGIIGAGSLADAFVRKYDSNGIALWTRQFGSPAQDGAWDIAADGAGNAYVAGATFGAFPDRTWAGAVDAFLRVYDPDGTEVWTRQFGTSDTDFARGVAVDPVGNVFVSGLTQGALPGQTSAGSFDAFLRKYDSSGAEVWTHQFGTPTDCPGCFGFDEALGVAVDAAGNAYLVGTVGGPLPGETFAGGGDAFVRKYDSTGSVVWTRQFGTAFSDYTTDVAVTDGGKLYASGQTFGALTGQTSAGGFDAFAVEVAADTEPPILSVALSPNVLWPPDHRMVAIGASIQVSDNCDSSPLVTLVSVTSNEPDNDVADGDTVNDIQIVGPTTFLLRAERSAAGTGRIYTVTYMATDASGNTSAPVSATVTVPLTIK